MDGIRWWCGKWKNVVPFWTCCHNSSFYLSTPHGQLSAEYGVFSKLVTIQAFTYLPHTDCIRLGMGYFFRLCTIYSYFSPYGTSFQWFENDNSRICTIYVKKFLYGTDLKHFKNYNLAICTILIKFPTYGTNRNNFSEPKSNICTIQAKNLLYGTD